MNTLPYFSYNTATPTNQSGDDLGSTNRVLVPLLIIGLAAIPLHVGLTTETTTALLWALAMGSCGLAIGFLFGIPKIIQTDRVVNKSPDYETDQPYSQRVNTNLTDISDWLTKIIVGLGLINLTKIPPKIDQLANVVAAGINTTNPAGEKSFAVALVICFLIIGFSFGYLYTRLFLTRAFFRADQGAEIKIQKIIETEAQVVKQIAISEDKLQPTQRQYEAAGKVEQLAAQTDISITRQQLLKLARNYESIRAASPASDERTRKMAICITKMRTLALAGYALLSEFSSSPAPGDALVAVSMLQVRSDPSYLNWLANQIIVGTPFLGYQSAIALQFAVRSLGQSHADTIKIALEKAIAPLNDEKSKNTDRYKVLANAIKELMA